VGGEQLSTDQNGADAPLPTSEFAELRAHLLAHSVKRGDFVLKSGRKSSWFIDSKQTVCRPEAMLLVADAVLSATGRPSTLKEIVPDRPGHDRRYLLDSSKIRRALGWEPTIDFAEGLAETVKWYTDHRSWWEPLRDRAPVVEGAWSPNKP